MKKKKDVPDVNTEENTEINIDVNTEVNTEVDFFANTYKQNK